MRYLKPVGTPIKIGDKTCHLLFTLDAIDELQDKTEMSINKLMFYLTQKRHQKTAIKLILKYLTGEEIEPENLDYYSELLLNTYIEQLKYKDMPKPKGTQENDGECELIDVEYWLYIGTTVLMQPKSEVWGMTLGEIRTLKHKHDIYTGAIKEDKVVNIDDVC